MEAVLSQAELSAVETKIKEFELSTGCEMLLVVAKAADHYPAASMRFGLWAGLVVTLIFSNYFHFQEGYLWPVSFFAIAWICIWIGQYPLFKRLGLSENETDRECQEKAIELFHTLGSSKVTHKVTAMIMVSALERNIQVLVDQRIKEQISQNEIDDLVIIMQKHFKAGNLKDGLIASMQSLEDKILRDFGGKASNASPSELKDTVVFI